MKDDLTQTDMIKPQIKNDMLKAQAKIAKSINWKVVDNWREKLGAQDNFEMLLDYDFGVYYENRKLIPIMKTIVNITMISIIMNVGNRRRRRRRRTRG